MNIKTGCKIGLQIKSSDFKENKTKETIDEELSKKYALFGVSMYKIN